MPRSSQNELCWSGHWFYGISETKESIFPHRESSEREVPPLWLVCCNFSVLWCLATDSKDVIILTQTDAYEYTQQRAYTCEPLHSGWIICFLCISTAFFSNSTYTKMCYFLQNQGASSIYNTRFKDEHKSFSSPIELKNFNSSMDFNSIGELNFPKCFLDIARFPLERINYFYLLWIAEIPGSILTPPKNQSFKLSQSTNHKCAMMCFNAQSL